MLKTYVSIHYTIMKYWQLWIPYTIMKSSIVYTQLCNKRPHCQTCFILEGCSSLTAANICISSNTFSNIWSNLLPLLHYQSNSICQATLLFVYRYTSWHFGGTLFIIETALHAKFKILFDFNTIVRASPIKRCICFTQSIKVFTL